MKDNINMGIKMMRKNGTDPYCP